MSIRKMIGLSCAALLGLMGGGAQAAHIAEGNDYYWTAGPGPISFEVEFLNPGGVIGNAGDLVFGAFFNSDPDLAEPIFGPGFVVGDTFDTDLAGPLVFGFFLANVGDLFDGPYAYYSDSRLNPDGLDAFAATDLGNGAWLLEFEDLFLPLEPGMGDVRVIATGIRPLPVSEPAVWLLVGTGAIVLLARRKRH